jgi:GTP:adenosylcobinamide-phosphate guanylyltransferase
VTLPSPDACFTAVVLAGIRPSGDPLAAARGVPRKALIPVGGTPMIVRVLTALRASPWVARIAICGVDRATLEGGGIAAGDLSDVIWLEAADHPATSVVAALDQLGAVAPVLVTTGDHPLLTAAIVDEFCAAAQTSGGEVAAAVVDAATVRQAYPDALRTFYPLRDAAYTGCNLFAFFGAGGRRAAVLWREVDRYRKKPWRVVGLLGPVVLLRFALRRLSLDDVMEVLSDRMGVRARVVRMSAADAGIDVDKPADVELVERILAERPA